MLQLRFKSQSCNLWSDDQSHHYLKSMLTAGFIKVKYAPLPHGKKKNAAHFYYFRQDIKALNSLKWVEVFVDHADHA